MNILQKESDLQRDQLQNLKNELNLTKNIMSESTFRHEQEIKLQKLTLIKQQNDIKELSGKKRIWDLVFYGLGYRFPLIPLSLILLLIVRRYKGIPGSFVVLLLMMYLRDRI